MTKISRRFAIAAPISIAVLIPLAAQPATAAVEAPTSAMSISSDSTAAVTPGQAAWLSVPLVGGGCDIRNVSIVMEDLPTGYTLSYPTAPRTGSDTSLYKDDVLSAGEVDFASFNLTVPANTSRTNLKLKAKVSYEYNKTCHEQKSGAADWKDSSKTFQITIPYAGR